MTTGNEMEPAPSRRMARSEPTRSAAVARRTPAARWSRRRNVLSGFAVLATLGFVAAYAVPTGAALADSDASPEAVSAFASASEEAQAFEVSSHVDTGATFAARLYSVHVPPPPPPPEPEPEPEPAEAGPPTEPEQPVVEEAPPADDGGGEDAQPAPSPADPPQYNGGGSPEQWMTAAGIAESDWGYVDYIVSKESGWNPNATNPSSGACGLVQAYPCSKVPGNGYDPVDNLRWGNGYAVGRYGSWAAAYQVWINQNWW